MRSSSTKCVLWWSRRHEWSSSRIHKRHVTSTTSSAHWIAKLMVHRATAACMSAWNVYQQHSLTGGECLSTTLIDWSRMFIDNTHWLEENVYQQHSLTGGDTGTWHHYSIHFCLKYMSTRLCRESANLHQGQNHVNKKWYRIRIWISGLGSGYLPDRSKRSCGFITLPASVLPIGRPNH